MSLGGWAETLAASEQRPAMPTGAPGVLIVCGVALGVWPLALPLPVGVAVGVRAALLLPPAQAASSSTSAASRARPIRRTTRATNPVRFPPRTASLLRWR